jgi:lipopolysaccharide export system permease protein
LADTPASAPASPAAEADTAFAGRPVLAGLSRLERERVVNRALGRARQLRSIADAGGNALRWEQQRADGYRVEVHKKVSMAVACLVFMLIGIPLGLRVPRAGFGRTAVTAVLLFLFYWATLNQGEKLADRGMLTPWVGMWAANLLTGAVGLWLFAREAREPAPLLVKGREGERTRGRGDEAQELPP